MNYGRYMICCRPGYLRNVIRKGQLAMIDLMNRLCRPNKQILAGISVEHTPVTMTGSGESWVRLPGGKLFSFSTISLFYTRSAALSCVH